MARYFVIHLTERDLIDRGQLSSDKPFEIQVLDTEGRAVVSGYVGREETRFEVAGRPIPKAVIESARNQPLGQGDYVDEHGNSVQPF